VLFLRVVDGPKITGNFYDQLPFGDAGVKQVRLTPA